MRSTGSSSKSGPKCPAIAFATRRITSFSIATICPKTVDDSTQNAEAAIPTAAISFGAYERTGNPELVALNCYAEQVPGPSGPQLQLRQRPSVNAFKGVGSGPLRAAASKDGVFGGAAIIVSGTVVWSLDATGVAAAFAGIAIGGSGLVDLDLGQDSNLNSVCRIATGEGLYLVEATGVSKETFPVTSGADSVQFHRGFWLAVGTGTQQGYYQVPGDTSWQALSFASAEYSPDPLVGIRTRGDQFALLGSSTFEPWTLTGSASPAMAPYGGINGDFGCRALATAVNCEGSLVFVDNKCRVRRWDGGIANVVSGPGLAELIRKVSAMDLKAWTYQVDDHRFYVLTLGADSTWVYDLDGQGAQWATTSSLGYPYWRATLGASMGDLTIALDPTTAQVYSLDPDKHMDGASAVPVTCSAVVDGQDTSIPCANVAMVLDFGGGPYSGQGAAPLIGMRYSDDQAKTWSAWAYQPLAVAGVYNLLPRWNGLGQIPACLGRIFQFTVSDPVGVIYKRLYINLS